jgi:DNA-binding NtrC family response regulator
LPATQSKPRSALVIGLPLIQHRSIRQALLGEGFRNVFHAEDGVEAAAILSSELVDMVFTPESGEGYSFRDVFSMIHGRSPNAQAPVVLLDEGVPRPKIVSAIKAGAAGVLPVPADRKALRALLNRIGNPGESPDSAWNLDGGEDSSR